MSFDYYDYLANMPSKPKYRREINKKTPHVIYVEKTEQNNEKTIYDEQRENNYPKYNYERNYKDFNNYERKYGKNRKFRNNLQQIEIYYEPKVPKEKENNDMGLNDNAPNIIEDKKKTSIKLELDTPKQEEFILEHFFNDSSSKKCEMNEEKSMIFLNFLKTYNMFRT